jgi:hypothetical protein
MFEPLPRLLLGLLTGIVFGWLLQRSGVSRFSTIVGQFLFRDFTMMKMMLTAIVTGGAGTYAMQSFGWVTLSVKPMLLGGVLLGSVLFGVGLAILGYCPGTGVAAAAQGSRDALAGVLGMFAGSALFSELYPSLKVTVLSWGDYGKLTLPQVTGLPWSATFLALGAVAGAFFVWLERRET